MPPTKLSDTDKQEILSLYRQTKETTSSLAERFEVSTSTISRILKQSLDEVEYDTLIQKKRSGASRANASDTAESLEISQLTLADSIPTAEVADSTAVDAEIVPVDAEMVPDPAMLEAAVIEPDEVELSSSSRRQRKRSTTAIAKPVKPSPIIKSPISAPVLASLGEATDAEEFGSEPEQEVSGETPVTAELEAVERDILKKEQVFDDLEEEDDGDEDEDLDDDSEDDDDLSSDSDYLADLTSMHIPVGKPLHILPLSEAAIPRICYLVVDRTSDLVTRPLKDFAELGQIPDHEIQEKTLPVFDNHRVAKRFMRRMQRVVKIPDGRVFLKVSPYLQAKGITRLLIDGQVYSL